MSFQVDNKIKNRLICFALLVSIFFLLCSCNFNDTQTEHTNKKSFPALVQERNNLTIEDFTKLNIDDKRENVEKAIGLPYDEEVWNEDFDSSIVKYKYCYYQIYNKENIIKIQVSYDSDNRLKGLAIFVNGKITGIEQVKNLSQQIPNNIVFPNLQQTKDNLSIETLNNVKIGDSKKDIIEMLGEPYDIEYSKTPISSPDSYLKYMLNDGTKVKLTFGRDSLLTSLDYFVDNIRVEPYKKINGFTTGKDYLYYGGIYISLKDSNEVYVMYSHAQMFKWDTENVDGISCALEREGDSISTVMITFYIQNQVVQRHSLVIDDMGNFKEIYNE